MVELITVDTEEVVLVSFLEGVAYLVQVVTFDSIDRLEVASYLAVEDPLELALALELDL